MNRNSTYYSYLDQLWERANELEYMMIESYGKEYDMLATEFDAIMEEIEQHDITLEEIEMMRKGEYV